jgi:hypothetical protein
MAGGPVTNLFRVLVHVPELYVGLAIRRIQSNGLETHLLRHWSQGPRGNSEGRNGGENLLGLAEAGPKEGRDVSS